MSARNVAAPRSPPSIFCRYAIGLAEGGSEKAGADGSATATATVGGAAAGTAPTTYLAYAIPLLILLFALYWQFGQSAK